MSEALTKAGCTKLELEAHELQAEYRPALTAAGRDGKEAEIYIYDTLPGGAGFARRVGNLGLSVFEKALKILEECPDNCDRSCYRCLRSYKNKFEHDLLDRHLGASLLRFLLTGAPPTLDEERLEQSTERLYQDLERQGLEGLTFERNQLVTIPGLSAVRAPIYVMREDGAQFIIALHGPLTPNYFPDPALQKVRGYAVPFHVLPPIDELVVRRNLPKATGDVIANIR